ncbi:MAG: RNA polymerase sigma-70 factor (ECF subfamily) [Verrucomicrobiales bacterium]|jgi:RNA polymerase sigma-70 factor (ECF subfamily)
MNKPSPEPSNQAHPSDGEDASEDRQAIAERDQALVIRCKEGDNDAFNQLVTHYRGKVYAMIVNMIRNDADAWDLAQDVFVKVWKALPKFEARSAFYTWLYRITHNVTYDWMRKKKITAGTEFDDAVALDAEPGARTAPQVISQPDENVQGGEIKAEIDAAIQELSADHRQAILLKEVDGLSYQEIADVMECSIGTVMSRLFYARKKLQEKLKGLRA